jgi:hypothetical protein
VPRPCQGVVAVMSTVVRCCLSVFAS